jgi:hypothetical protein
MTIEIAFGWWLLPLFATVCAWAWAWWWCSTEEISKGGFWPSIPFYPLVAVPAATIASLVAWLIWSLLT